MKRLAAALVAVIVLGGCATTATSQRQGTAFTGEVWTWDEQLNTVTLRQGGQTVRVQVTPDQIAGLTLHERRTVYGELAPPLPIVSVVTPPGSVQIVPRGEAETSDVTGTVAAIDPQGTLAVTTAKGNLFVWGAGSGQTMFKQGDAVRVRTRVQAVDRVPVAPAAAGGGAAVTPAPAASPSTEPGDYAVVVGRVMAIAPSGTLRVESPRGPVEVWVPTPERYRTANAVEVRTAVTPAR